MKGIIDSTLREGVQTFGLTLSVSQKKEILAGLWGTGIEEIEIGIASPFAEDLPELMQFCREHGACSRVALWSRCRQEDILQAYHLRPDVLSLSIPVSDIHIEKKLGRKREWVLETAKNSLVAAQRLGFEYISLGLEDATRAEFSFLQRIIKTAVHTGVNRIRIADTVGIANPLEIAELVRKITGLADIEVGVHMHNDFGMATANSLAALDAGAHWADATVLGLGERAGNACLEELVSYLVCKRDMKYKLDSVARIAKKTARMCGRKIESYKPIIGEEIFSCETGLHIQGLQKDTSTYEPFHPELVGACRKIRYGGKIGRKELLIYLNGVTKTGTSFALEEWLHRIRKKAESKGQPLNEAELLLLIPSSMRSV